MPNDYLTMEAPTEDHSSLFDLIRYIAAWVISTAGVVFGFNKFVGAYFELRIKQQEKFIEDVIDRKMQPEIKELSQSIKNLEKAIWEMNKK